MPLRAVYSLVSIVASEMLLRAVTLAGGFCAIPLLPVSSLVYMPTPQL